MRLAKNSILRFIPALLMAGMFGSASAAVIVTYAEQPFDYNSSLANTSVFDFNNLSTGKNTNVSWDGVGTFSQLYVLNADSYGGAADAKNPYGTKYSVQGVGTPVNSTDLLLNKDSSYFGMWWSAGDAKNVLEFYNDRELIGRFTTSSLMNPLPLEYDGNPLNKSINSGEPYAFINFFADPTAAWNRIVFTNDGSSGFESDNYTSRVLAWNPMVDGALPGVPVALVDGKTTTLVKPSDLAGTPWSAAPGAPLPPLPMMMAFGLAALLGGRGFRFRFRSPAVQAA